MIQWVRLCRLDGDERVPDARISAPVAEAAAGTRRDVEPRIAVSRRQ